MDINQAKTFLTVIQLRNFNLVAEKLFISQSTVSTRIKVLEEQLNCRLFIRNKSGVTLTPAAKRFERHAQSIVQLWEHAKNEVMLHEEIDQTLTIGARYGLWEPLLLNWLIHIREDFPHTKLQVKIGTPSSLAQKMYNGTMDMCIVYSPHTTVGLKPLKLFDENFVMVATSPLSTTTLPPNYIYVDWGKEFDRKHDLHFPSTPKSMMSANLGILAKSLIIKTNSIGYLPLRLAKQDILDNTLYIVDQMPTITIPVFVIYSEHIDEELRTKVLQSLVKDCTLHDQHINYI
jgi:DNA-binding transcriptional LysR family regulator